MDVFVIPIGSDRYELYCEHAADGDVAPEGQDGVVGRLRQRFTDMLRAAEERQRTGDAPAATTWAGRVQESVMAWVAQRVAEQRLLWNLRRESAAVLVHPGDMTFAQVLTLVRRILKQDHDRHRRWLVIDTTLLVASAVLAIVPGPNLVAYYFAFRVFGHWLSMRGARQGLDRVAWSGRACPPLDELRALASLADAEREARVQDVARRLQLQHLPSFFARVA